MPLAHVRYNLVHEGSKIDLDTIRALGPALQLAVAKHLHSADGTLTTEDIEVTFQEAHPFDVGSFQINIDIEAMHKPLRDKGDQASGEPDFNSRMRALGNDIRQMLPSHVGFGLWAKLNNACWFDYEPEPATSGKTS